MDVSGLPRTLRGTFEPCMMLIAGRDLGEIGLDSYLSAKQITSYISKDRWDWFSPNSKL